MVLKKFLSVAFLVGSLLPVHAQHRNEIQVPNLDGLITLKCDFHIHTVFSDGLVWPTVRVDEAYREGLDAISLTEHIAVSYTHLTLPTNHDMCRSRWSPYH